MASWNLLSPTVHEAHEKHMPWQDRLPAFQRIIGQLSNIDVLCFQEVDVTVSFPTLRALLRSAGYSHVLQHRSADGQALALAMFFRESRCRKVWEEHRSRTLGMGLQLLDGRVLAIVNVHLEAGDEDGNAEPKRQAQLASVLSKVDAQNPWATVVCGDFNSSVSAGSMLCDYLEDAGLNRVVDASPSFAGFGSVSRLDHIFASPCLLKPCALELAMLSQEELEAGLPSADHPSDHVPVGACFRLPLVVPRPTPKPASKPTVRAAVAATMTEPCKEFKQEWCALTWTRSQAALRKGKARKGALAEHRATEAEFLLLLSAGETEYLMQWRKGAADASKIAIRELAAKVFSSADMP